MELGVAGDKRLCKTSSRSASLSSSVSATRSPLPLPSFDLLATCPPHLFFAGRESASTLLARLLPSLSVPGEEAIAMRSSSEGRTAGFGGVFSLSEEHAPSEVFFGERSGDRGNRDGELEGDAVPTMKLKSSFVGWARGENMTMSVRWMVAVFDGRWGEHIARVAASGVDGTTLMGAGETSGLESCEVIVTSDALSSSAAMVDEEPQLNAGSSMGTAVVPTAAMSPISTSDVGSVVAPSLLHALRQVITVDGHPPFGTESLAKVKSQ
jgi:hypothetical protein